MCPIMAGLSYLSICKGLVYGGVVKLVDTLDSKSSWGNSVPVRVRPPLPFLNSSKLVSTIIQKIINQTIG